MPKYQGKDVTQRPVKETDPGYDKAKDQTVVTLADGSEKTVEKSEVK